MNASQPLRLYGLKISYYTGKMEAYLRYKEIPHEFVTLNPALMRRLKAETGAAQMPAVELPDGRFMTDTTPMIAWFEAEQPEPSVLPADPVLRFVSLLLEDYFEEWLWRPAMHYRWSYRADRLHLSRKIVDELLADVPQPGFIKRFFIRRRQLGEYVRKDGVSEETWDHVESIYLNTLAHLERVFAQRPYLLGESPSVADFGLFASMFRHFAQDPTASDIMRAEAPGVFAWQARLWNARGGSTEGPFLAALPADLSPILESVGSAYLPYLNDNAKAWQQGLSRFDPIIEGVPYRDVPVSQYRVWCLEELQRQARAVPESAQPLLKGLLGDHGCLEPLFALADPGSRYDESREAPFRGRKVHYQNRRD
ncbi:MAG: glutathione S-transferase family protein [Pseudomonadota bacterium]